jgi:conjugal transfer pilus assembly protein TraW
MKTNNRCSITNRFTKWFTVFAFLCCTSDLFAANLGVVGETFPVAEMSFLSFIESRLSQLQDSDQMQAIQARMIAEVTQHVNRPASLNLSRINQSETHHYTPGIVLRSPIIDHLNQILIPAGTRVNALEQLPSYQPNWMFLDADDHAQLLWGQLTLKAHPDARVILTGGSVADAENRLNTEIFFDQQARITHQLEIRHVPAFVLREGLTLRIEEVAIQEDGHAR